MSQMWGKTETDLMLWIAPIFTEKVCCSQLSWNFLNPVQRDIMPLFFHKVLIYRQVRSYKLLSVFFPTRSFVIYLISNMLSFLILSLLTFCTFIIFFSLPAWETAPCPARRRTCGWCARGRWSAWGRPPSGTPGCRSPDALAIHTSTLPPPATTKHSW